VGKLGRPEAAQDRASVAVVVALAVWDKEEESGLLVDLVVVVYIIL